MELGLENRVAIVCGASKGIGKAISKGLAAHGANVCLISPDPSVLDETVADLSADGFGEAVALAGDVTDPALAKKALKAVIDRWGRVDILVNNAGGPPPGGFLEHDDETWTAAFELNLMSAIRFTRAVAPVMKDRRWGRIVNVTSTLAKEPTPQMVLSATIRAGVSTFSKAIAAELAPFNITINTVCPGGVKTDRLVSLFSEIARKNGKDPQELIRNSEESIPIGRFAEADEFAQMVLFLLSEKGSYVTGTTISIDGAATKSVF